jgi:hypothetical protein
LQIQVPIAEAADNCLDGALQHCITEHAPHIQHLAAFHKFRPQKKQVSYSKLQGKQAQAAPDLLCGQTIDKHHLLIISINQLQRTFLSGQKVVEKKPLIPTRYLGVVDDQHDKRQEM